VALTDHASLYGALNEHAINRVAQLLEQERPSLFNYATKAVIAQPSLLCQALNTNPEVAKRNNPMITEKQALPVLGTNGLYFLDYGFQLSIIQIDFAPGSSIALPPELSPLQPQCLAAHIGVSGGVACPSSDVIQQLVPVADLKVPTVIPTSQLSCFSVDAFIVLGAELSGTPPNEMVNVHFDGFKLLGFVAPGLEAILECYVNVVMQLAVLPRLKTLIRTAFQFPLQSLPLRFDLTFTPISSNVPFNPAVEDDQVKVYLDAQVVKI
jgi:hypothetical protein